MKKNYTISYNPKRGKSGAFCISYRNLQGQWKIKWAPNTYKEHQSLEVEQWFILQYQNLLANGTFLNEVKVSKTLESLAPQWLAYRYNLKSLSQNYYKVLHSTVHSWLLDNDNHPHLSIQRLELETDFTPNLIIQWLESLSLSPSSKLNVAGVLRNLFTDLIGKEVLDENMRNPMDKHPVKKHIDELEKAVAKLKELAARQGAVKVISRDAVQKLIHHTKEPMRRLKYFLALTTGLRDNEIQGLTFADLFLDHKVPHVDISKQLLKGGIFPAKQFETLIYEGMDRDVIMSLPNALLKDPKSTSNKKNNSIRLVPLHSELVLLLRQWLKKGFRAYTGQIPSLSSPVFPRAKKSPQPGCFCQSDSAPMLRHDLELLGLPSEGITFHMLRHTFASMCEEVGLHEGQIGVLLGHAANSVTRENYLTTQLPLYAAAIQRFPISIPEVREQSGSQVVS